MMKLLLITLLAALGTSHAKAAEVTQSADVSVQQVFLDTHGGKSYKFTEYRTMPNGVVFDKYTLGVDWETYFLDCEARRITLADQDYRCDGGQPGKLTWSLGWDQTPHVFSYDARSPFRQTSRGVLALPDTVQSTMQTTVAEYAATANGPNSWNRYLQTHAFLQPAETRDDAGSLGLRYRPLESLALTLTAGRITKTGTRPLGASNGFQAGTEVLEPIDYVTHEMSFGAEFAQPSYQASFRYDFSDFVNKTTSLTWDNPKRLTDQLLNTTGYSAGDRSAAGRMALNPSNQMHTFTLAGGLDLPAKTRVSAEASYGLLLARNLMQPYTVNSAMVSTNPVGGVNAGPYTVPFNLSDPANLPSRYIDNKVNVYSLLVKVANNAWSDLKTAVELKTFAEVNKNVQHDFPGHVVFDQNWQYGDDETKRHTWQTDRLTAKADYRVSEPVSVGASYTLDRRRQEREVEHIFENTGTLATVVRPNHKTMLNVSYTHAKRRGRDFHMEHQNDTPGLRRIDISDRDRNEGRVQGQYTTDGGVMTSLSTRLVHDKHKPGKGALDVGTPTRADEMYGILENRGIIASADIDVPLDEAWSVDGFYSYDTGRMIFRGNANQGTGANSDRQLPINSYTLRQLEDSHVGGLAARWKKGQWDASGGYEVMASVMKLDPIAFNIFGNARTAQSLPSTKRYLQTLKVSSGYQLTKALKVVGRYMFERFDVADYALGDVPLRGDDTFTYLGISLRPYRAHVASLGVDYRF